jgi:hypothetical protein
MKFLLESDGRRPLSILFTLAGKARERAYEKAPSRWEFLALPGVAPP